MAAHGLAVGLALAVAACTSVQRVEPQRFIPQHRPNAVSVWTHPDDVTIVTNPEVEGDTLSGEVFEERWAVPLKDILRVEARAPDPKRTVLLVAGSAASAVGIYLMSSSSKRSSIPCGQGLAPQLQGELCGSTP